MIRQQHPGKRVSAALKAARLSQKKLADAIGVAPSKVSETLSGKWALSPAFCIGLEKLGVGTAEAWLLSYSRYELNQERIKQSSPQTPQ